jgi:formylglycine-generating enzyme required for sulfatase activity
MELVLIPSGKFLMGSPEGEERRDKEELQHEVEISRSFYLGKYEVTQKEFRNVMGYNPSWFSKKAAGKKGAKYLDEPGGGKEKLPPGDDGEDYPVENILWGEAKEFCEKLTAKDEKRPHGWVYRLPTESEWEYSCRGGSRLYQVFHFGDSISSTQANFNGNLPYGGADKGKCLERTCKVGSYKANGFGLHDMHGNVREWCQDLNKYKYYRENPKSGPVDPSENEFRVIRGASWLDAGWYCRSASRSANMLKYRDAALGFRVSLVPPSK